MESKENTFVEGYIERSKEAIKICKECKYRKKARRLEIERKIILAKLLEDKKELTEELKYNMTKREARQQLLLVNNYLEILKGEADE